MKSTLGVGPITSASGNALNSEHERDEWGAAFLAGIEFNWPLWSWGRQKNNHQAVKHGLSVKKAENQEKWLEVSYQVKEAYYGYLLAHSLKDFVDGVEEKLKSALKEAKSFKKKKKESIYRLEILLGQVSSKKNEIASALKIASAGLKVRSGHKKELYPTEEWLSSRFRKIEALEYYQDKALQNNVQILKIASGVKAQRELIVAEKKGGYPVVGLLFKYNYTQTDVREDQKSLFAYDPYNRSEALLGVGLQWDWQFGKVSQKVKKIKLEEKKLLLKQEFAKRGIPELVKKAWEELIVAEKNVRIFKKTQKAGKKWLARAAIGWGTGLADSKKLVEAFSARAQTRRQYLEAIYQYELKWGALSRVVGREVDPNLL